jgi:hypothetical protein
MVVVLLLILSILATAYLSTARVDRVTSGQDIQNAQVDQLVDGVKDMAVSNIVDGLFAYNSSFGQQYKAAITNTYATANSTIYTNVDSPDYQGTGLADTWLADRLPSVPTISAQANTTNNLPFWGFISAPLNSEFSDGSAEFDSPAPPITYPVANPNAFVTGVSAPFTYTARTNLQPTFVTMPGTTTVYPAFQVAVNANRTSVPAYMIAGDADGDGIADCGLFRLPGFFADGLTYYAGVRIIDNNSAINANTAWDNQEDYHINNGQAYFPAAGTSFFPSAVGLAEWLDFRDTVLPTNVRNVLTFPARTGIYPQSGYYVIPQRLSEYRLGLAGPFSGAGNRAPFWPGTPITLAQVNSPFLLGTYNSTTPDQFDYSRVVNDGGAGYRSDGLFGSLAEAMSEQLGRRLDNPGNIYNNVAGPAYPHYCAFGDADAEALAFHFCLVNPPTGGAAETAVESALNYAAFQNAPNDVPLLMNFSNGGKWNLAAGAWKSYPPPIATSIAVGVPAADAALVPQDWFNGSFDYSALNNYYAPDAGPGTYAAPPSALGTGVLTVLTGSATYAPNLRPLLVTRNGVSITAPPNTYGTSGAIGQITSSNTIANLPPGIMPYGDRGRYHTGVLYSINDIVTYALTPNVNVTPPAPNSYDYFEMQSQAFLCTSPTSAAPLSPAGALQAGWDYVMSPGRLSASLPTIHGGTLVKADANTALFPELLRAYWNVMNEGAKAGATMFVTSPIRESAPVLSAQQTQILRAALAAVNTETIRSPLAPVVPGPQNVVARQVYLNGNYLSSRLYATVYGAQPQPFITEVYFQTDTTTPGYVPAGTTNSAGYVAVELYNPYTFDIPLVPSSLASGDCSWEIATMARGSEPKTLNPVQGPPGYPTETFPIGPYSSTVANNFGLAVVPAGGYLLLENFNPSGVGGSTAAYRPQATGLPITIQIPGVNGTSRSPFPTLNTLYVPNLASVIGSEMVIMKRRHYDGTPSVGVDGPTYSWNDSSGVANNLNDFVPVDSFYFTGLSLGTGAQASELHYARPSGPGSAWQFVYPGKYLAGQTDAQLNSWTNPATTPDPWISTPPVTFSLGATANTTAASNASTNATAPLTPLPYAIPVAYQIWNASGLTNSLSPGNLTGNKFPYGGFPRNGDLLQVPYIGAYEIYTLNTSVSPPTRTILEVNPITMDAFLAAAGIGGNEQVGRFCPITGFGPAADALNQPVSTPPTNTSVAYDWTRSLFDYLSVQSPRADYFPNTDPNRFPPFTAPNVNAPAPVANSDSSALANTEAENTQTVQGLINVNTAPWQVLATLPLAVYGTGANQGQVDTARSIAIAQAIVADRKINGPFYSIFDLNRVKDPTTNNLIFQTGDGDQTANNANPSFNGTSIGFQGNITPGSTLGNNFDELFLQTTRLSNLITTRSDSFTVYIVVEGWQNASSGSISLPPVLKVTRRAAFIVDRSTVTPLSRTVRTVTVPNN